MAGMKIKLQPLLLAIVLSQALYGLGLEVASNPIEYFVVAILIFYLNCKAETHDNRKVK
jgi:hypothetical protein